MLGLKFQSYFPKLRAFWKNRKAETGAVIWLIGIAVILIAVGLFLVSAIMPSAISTFEAANTTGWGDSVVTIWGIIPLFAVLATVITFVAVLIMILRKAAGE